MKVFPRDCEECEHFSRWDMSVDDYTNTCGLLNVQMDDCDIEFSLPIACPKKDTLSDDYEDGDYEEGC